MIVYSPMNFSVKYLCDWLNYNYTCSSRITLSLTLAVGNVFTPYLCISFLITFTIPFAVSPVIGRKYIPEKYAKLDKKKGFYNTLLSSTIHSLIVSSGTGYLLITGGLGNNPVYSKSPFGFAVMQISLGYFLADFIVCLLDKNLRQDFGSLAHHVAGIILLWGSSIREGLCFS